MKITIHRHGGFAGTSEALLALDSKSLSDEQAAAVHGVVKHIEQLIGTERPVGADFIRYEILIEEGGTQRILSFADDDSEKAHQLSKLMNTIMSAG